MDAWVSELRRGSPETAWDAFLERYRRLIFAAIRHYAQDYDDVMDVFARVCESLRADVCGLTTDGKAYCWRRAPAVEGRRPRRHWQRRRGR